MQPKFQDPAAELPAPWSSNVGQNMIDAGSEYPKMLFKTGCEQVIHGHKVDTCTVDDAEAEEEHLVDGWRLTADPEAKQSVAQRVANDTKDAEIAELRAQLEEERRRRGGRPKAVDAGIAIPEQTA